ncbi:MAG: 3-dehydroquinate synthase, partial [Clostridia bacterium]|nr:3-dehydroquinate synthase [Clostridia bacterium]
MQEIALKTPTTSATIYIGDDALALRLFELVAKRECFVVTDSNVRRIHAAFFETYFKDVPTFVLPAGEENKTFAYLGRILEEMQAAGLHRSARLFAVGGGVVGDMAGLAAALYMRGISCVQIPTTLLAQVDSSVGGKTAVDLCGVKNIVGAFYQPQEVLIAPMFLKTLPPREIKCGLGEIVKYAALNGEIFERLSGGFEHLTELIAACVTHKARVVEEDEKETFARKALNVGHTTGHAIELSSGLSHGECVLYGMRWETEIAIEKGVCEEDYGKKLLAIIERALKTEPRSKLCLEDVDSVAEKAKADKKNDGDGEIKMAVAKKQGEWTLLSLPFEEYKSVLKKVIA